MDIILGKERRRWAREDKLAIVTETFAPGAVILEIARRRQVSSGQIHTWRKQFRAELGFPALEPGSPMDPTSPSSMRFMPLAIATEAAPTTIEIEFSAGATMKITGAVDAPMMAALVTALAPRSR